MSKKSIFRYSLSAIILLMILVVFSGCNNLFNDNSKTSNDGKVFLKVNVASASRTALPEFSLSSISGFNFTLTGKAPGASTFTALTDDPTNNPSGVYAGLEALQQTSFPVETGDWTFKLTASLEGTVLSSQEVSKTITSGSNTLSFNLVWEDTNLDITQTGSLNFTFDFSAVSNKNDVARVTGRLYDYDTSTGDEIDLADVKFSEKDLTVTDGVVTYSLTEIPSGTYRIKIRLYDNKSNLIANWPENAIITGGQLSSNSISVSTLNQVYSIDFITNGGTIDAGITLPEQYTRFTYDSSTYTTPWNLPAADKITRTGYSFGGWYDNIGFEGSPVTAIPANSTGNLHYYAKWTVNSYTIEYKNIDNGDWKSGFTPQTSYTIEDSVTLPTSSNIERANAQFLGWYTSHPETSNFYDTSVITGWTSSANKAEPVVVYARWKYNKGINVSIDSASTSVLEMDVKVDGSDFDASVNMITSGYGPANSKTIVFTPILSQTGYTCSWKVDDTVQTTTVDANNALTITTTGWQPGIYDIQFTANKGSVSDAVYESYYAQVEVKSIGTKPAPTAVDDIVFNDGSAIPYTSGMTFTDEQKESAVAVIFYKGKELNDGADTQTRLLGIGFETQTAAITTRTSDTHLDSIASELSTTPTEHSYQITDGDDTIKYFTGLFNGSVNWPTLCAEDSTIETNAQTEYPAFYWVNTYGTTLGLTVSSLQTGWYMPSLVELYTVYQKLADINNIINNLGKTQIANSYYYVSSSAFKLGESNYNYQNCVYFYTGKRSGMLNTNEFRVCAIREF